MNAYPEKCIDYGLNLKYLSLCELLSYHLYHMAGNSSRRLVVTVFFFFSYRTGYVCCCHGVVRHRGGVVAVKPGEVLRTKYLRGNAGTP